MLVGVIGAPNQGKSTFFNALTLAGAEVSPRPFTTIKPNEGVAYVKVKRLRADESPVKGYVKGDYRFIPVRVLDVAGLVPGASKGRGLGNQFMNDLVSADAFIIVVDASGETDAEGNAVTNYDPASNVSFLLDELDSWLNNIVSSNWESVRKKDSPEKLLAEKLSGIGIRAEHIESAMKSVGVTDLMMFSKKLRELSKPFIITANKIDKPHRLDSLRKYGLVISASAAIEYALRKADKEGFIEYVPGGRDFKVIKQLSPDQERGLNYAGDFLKEQGTGVQECINAAVFELLKCRIVYPVQDEGKWTDAKGNVLPDSFLVEPDCTALKLAFKVHTSIGEGFIRAVDARTKRVLGKDYLVKDGDIIKIVSKS